MELGTWVGEFETVRRYRTVGGDVWGSMSKKLSKKEKELAFKMHLIDKVYSLAVLAIKFIVPAVAIVECVDILAGKTTIAEFVLMVFGVDYSDAWKYLAYTVLGIWAYTERKLRRTKTKRLHVRIKELETLLDPQRTSSGLPSTGETRKDDR